MGFRISQSPFADSDDTNLDIYPLFFYENGDFYLDGLEAGYRLFKGGQWSAGPVARYRFFDVPVDYQDKTWRDALDLGGKFS